jgi:peptide chain release factor 2
MAERDYNGEIAALSQTLSGIEQVLDLPKLKVDAANLEEEAGAPDLWNDTENAQRITSKLQPYPVSDK